MIDIKEVLKAAKEAGASDVHITVGVPPKFRINGSLVTTAFPRMLPPDTEAVMEAILTPEQKEKFLATGEYDMSYGIPELGRYRINIFKQRGTVALAFRLVNIEIPDPDMLGVPESVIDLYQRKRGLILVTGPTGSGKSTTLAAIINKINQCRDAHIITLEDPIEYLHSHRMSVVNQREIGLDTRSYADALRAALREDPDVILVGEMRDYETISVAVTAAETGHLVLSTLHTIGAASTVDRIIDVFPPHQQQQIRVQLANTLEAVISQQLIPTEDGKRRVAAFEVLHANNAIKNLIREGKSHQMVTVMQTNRKMGMIQMDEAIVQLFYDGLISGENAIQFAVDPDAMEKRVFIR